MTLCLNNTHLNNKQNEKKNVDPAIATQFTNQINYLQNEKDNMGKKLSLLEKPS